MKKNNKNSDNEANLSILHCGARAQAITAGEFVAHTLVVNKGAFVV